MTSAKELFEELGYTLTYENDGVLEFSKTDKFGRDYIVNFNKNSKDVMCINDSEKDISEKPLCIDYKLLITINKQFEELRWIE